MFITLIPFHTFRPSTCHEESSGVPLSDHSLAGPLIFLQSPSYLRVWDLEVSCSDMANHQHYPLFEVRYGPLG